MGFQSYKLVYKKILFPVFYFSMSCLIQCNTCQFFLIICEIDYETPHLYFDYNCVVAGSSVDGFSAIKMTALGRPQFLVTLLLTLAQVKMLSVSVWFIWFDFSYSCSSPRCWSSGGASSVCWRLIRGRTGWRYSSRSWSSNNCRFVLYTPSLWLL